jgi:hypothetical protein
MRGGKRIGGFIHVFGNLFMSGSWFLGFFARRFSGEVMLVFDDQKSIYRTSAAGETRGS